MLDSNFNSNFDSKKFSKGNVEHVKMGMNKVMADCVVHSKDIVPYDTGTLHNSIQIQDFAQQDGKSIIGRWGSRAVNYANPESAANSNKLCNLCRVWNY